MSGLNRKLTVKQRKFCWYFVETGNATQSAIKAGYSKRSARVTAHNLLTKPNIHGYVRAQLKKIQSRSIANSKEIFQFYTNVVRAKITEDSVGSTVDGEFKVKKRPDIKDRISAANELMKRYDPLVKAKLQKLRAEAEIKKYDAKQDNSAQNKTINQTTKLLKKLENAGKK